MRSGKPMTAEAEARAGFDALMSGRSCVIPGVWNAILDPTGEEALTDDVFDLLPGIPYEVRLKPGQSPMIVAYTGNQLLIA